MRLTAATIAIFSLVTIGLGLVCLTVALLLASPARPMQQAAVDAPGVLGGHGLVVSLVAAAVCGGGMLWLALRVRGEAATK